MTIQIIKRSEDMRKKYAYIIATALAISVMASCDKSEDDIIPNIKDTSFFFAPNDTCTDEESEIRRQFFKDHGSYLLFNDTIQHYFVGVNINGDSAYFTEVLDLSYSVNSSSISVSSSYEYTYTLLPNLTRKKKAVEFMEENILYHFTGTLQPFSWLLVNRIYCYTGTETTNPVAATGERAIAVAMLNLSRIRTEAQKENFTQQILMGIVNKIVSDNSLKFDSFSSVSANLYSRSFTGYENKTADECLQYLNSQGLLSRGKNELGTTANGYYPTLSTDLSDFARLVIVNDIETIKTRYSQYPTIIEKANLMIDCLKSLGYVFEKEETTENGNEE